MTSNRTLPRSARVLAATVLLMTTVLAATGGILLGSVPVLMASTAYAVVGGVIASRLLLNEARAIRRDAARDRAALADDNRRTAVARSKEQTAFANQMGLRMKARDARLAEFREAILTAEIDLAHSRERLSAERARTEALQADVNSAQSDLESARVDLLRANNQLTASQSAEIQVRAELLAWEEAADESERQRRERKSA